MKKRILIGTFLLLIIFGAFLAGAYLGEKGRYSVYGSKGIYGGGDNRFIQASGEMAALDFEPGLKPRIVKIKCHKLQNRYRFCAWAEFSVMNSSNLGLVDVDIIYDEDFVSWDEAGNIKIRDERENYTRTIDISVENTTLVDTYKYKNGEIRTTSLVDSFGKLGSR